MAITPAQAHDQRRAGRHRHLRPDRRCAGRLGVPLPSPLSHACRDDAGRHRPPGCGGSGGVIGAMLLLAAMPPQHDMHAMPGMAQDRPASADPSCPPEHEAMGIARAAAGRPAGQYRPAGRHRPAGGRRAATARPDRPRRRPLLRSRCDGRRRPGDAARAWRHGLPPDPVQPGGGVAARRSRLLSVGRRGLVRRRQPPAGGAQRG